MKIKLLTPSNLDRLKVNLRVSDIVKSKFASTKFKTKLKATLNRFRAYTFVGVGIFSSFTPLLADVNAYKSSRSNLIKGEDMHNQKVENEIDNNILSKVPEMYHDIVKQKFNDIQTETDYSTAVYSVSTAVAKANALLDWGLLKKDETYQNKDGNYYSDNGGLNNLVIAFSVTNPNISELVKEIRVQADRLSVSQEYSQNLQLSCVPVNLALNEELDRLNDTHPELYSDYEKILNEIKNIKEYLSSVPLENMSMWWNYLDDKLTQIGTDCASLYTNLGKSDGFPNLMQHLTKYQGLVSTVSFQNTIDKYFYEKLKPNNINLFGEPSEGVNENIENLIGAYQNVAYIDDYILRSLIGFNIEPINETIDISTFNWVNMISTQSGFLGIPREDMNIILAKKYGENCEVIKDLFHKLNLGGFDVNAKPLIEGDDNLTILSKFIYNAKLTDSPLLKKHYASSILSNHPEIVDRILDVKEIDVNEGETVTERNWDAFSVIGLGLMLSDLDNNLNLLRPNVFTSVISNVSQVPNGYKVFALDKEIINKLFTGQEGQDTNNLSLYTQYVSFLARINNTFPHYVVYQAMNEFNRTINVDFQPGSLDYAQGLAMTNNMNEIEVNDPVDFVPDVVGIPGISDDLERIFNTMYPVLSYLEPLQSVQNVRRYHNAHTPLTWAQASFSPQLSGQMVNFSRLEIILNDAFNKVYLKYNPLNEKLARLDLEMHGMGKGIKTYEKDYKVSAQGDRSTAGELNYETNTDKSYIYDEVKEDYVQSAEKYEQMLYAQSKNLNLNGNVIRNLLVDSHKELDMDKLSFTKVQDTDLLVNLDVTGSNYVVNLNAQTETESGTLIDDKKRRDIELRAYYKNNGNWYMITERNFYDDFSEKLEKNGIYAQMYTYNDRLRTGAEHLIIQPEGETENTQAWGAFFGFYFENLKTSVFAVKSKENEGAVTVNIVLGEDEKKKPNEMLSAGFYLLNDKDISYESSLTPGQELKGAKERGVMVLDYLALEKWKASIYYGGRTDREDFGGRIMNKNAGLGMGYMRNGNENWYMLSAGYDTKRVTGRSYFEQNNDLKEFGVLSSVNLGNTDNFKDISLDVYANTRFDSANPLKFGSDSELEQGVVSILNQYNDLEKTFGEIRNIKGDKEAEAFYQDNMLSITRNLIELMDDFNLDDNMYNSNAMAGFRINWYDQNGDYQTIKFTTTMTSVNDKNQLWAMVEYSMLRDKETLIQKLVPNTVMLAVPEKTNIDENESSKGMFGARWDFDKTVFSVVGFADKDSNVGLVGGASMKFPNAKENKYLGLQLGSSGTYYTMRAAYGGKNFAIATEFDKNIAGSKDLLLGIGASRFDRGLIFNLSAAFVQANYEKIPNIPATVDDLEVKYNNVMKAIKTNLSVSYPFVVYGTRTTLQGYLERLDVMKPLPTSEYEFGLKLGLGF